MTSHVIETDFEPDDAIAILAHASQFTNVDLTVIVGEGKPHNKIASVGKFLEDVSKKYPQAYNSITIKQGLGSKKKYPADDQTEIAEDSEETILANYTNAYSTSPAFAFMMKPPREAIKLKLQCPNTTVYCYGSFNWRTLKLETKEYQDLMARYAKFYYFDSFTAIGQKNSGMFKGTPNKVNDRISDLIIKWNHHTIANCEKDLAEYEAKPEAERDQNGIDRTKKIIESISAGINEQFVIADVCLFMCPLPTEQVKLEEINPYPKWVPAPDSNVYVFDSNLDARREKLLENLTKLTVDAPVDPVA
jgi:hypothetical protein